VHSCEYFQEPAIRHSHLIATTIVFRKDMVRELKAKPDIGALPRLFESTPAHIAGVICFA
jgi:hypothetical protein